jgi:hypothetical protein
MNRGFIQSVGRTLAGFVCVMGLSLAPTGCAENQKGMTAQKQCCGTCGGKCAGKCDGKCGDKKACCGKCGGDKAAGGTCCAKSGAHSCCKGKAAAPAASDPE